MGAHRARPGGGGARGRRGLRRGEWLLLGALLATIAVAGLHQHRALGALGGGGGEGGGGSGGGSGWGAAGPRRLHAALGRAGGAGARAAPAAKRPGETCGSCAHRVRG